MGRKAKLVLPTLETCQWRNRDQDGASCGLVAELLDDRVASVSDDACQACCRSFPPSRRQFNPVVASLLHKRAGEIIAVGGTDECCVDQAEGVRQDAEVACNLIRPSALTLNPARSSGKCCWSGETISGNHDGSQETSYRCHHPDHDVASSSRCRMCRDWSLKKPVSRVLTLEELLPVPEQRNGSVKKWAVAVTTAPRRVATLETTLDSITRAGWHEPRLFLDGTTHLPDRYSSLPVSWREDSIGAWPSWYMALAELILQQPDADAYMMLQDDVVLYDRESLRSYLERVLWPGDRPGLVSLFYTGLHRSSGWFEAKGAWHFSAQGFVIPSGIARSMLCDTDLSSAWLAASANKHVPIPEVMYEWTSKRDIDVWYATPSLAQHIGNTSTIWMNAAIVKGRRAPWFSGSVETELKVDESLADFSEQAFECDPDQFDEYSKHCETGRLRMQQSRVVICGLCRDVRPYLPRTAARIERLGQMFKDYRVVVFENDSVDATCEFLTDWKHHNQRVDVISEHCGANKYPQTRSPDRASWLAHCRNQYRERLIQRHADVDHVIVVDMDLPGGWSYDGVSHTFGHDDWDFVGSYGITPRLGRQNGQSPVVHHDVWAFRPAEETWARKLVNHNELYVQRGDPLLPVESCFGGLGVYRMECMAAAPYAGPDCEHVVFHARLRRLGLDRIFLNPSQITLY